MERLGTLPFVAQPGAAWVYGYNIDVLGCIVEKVSGQPLDAYISDHITKPLGMRRPIAAPATTARFHARRGFGRATVAAAVETPAGSLCCETPSRPSVERESRAVRSGTKRVSCFSAEFFPTRARKLFRFASV